ncbi:MAG: 1-acyl-sn-glycerol-3-phosphate acyltransferase [Candidatus Omnitrophica bacterium]|nr:1-acyl-sn-glycerol-3-phosphate acyltransferase [Candidatus Omnitrophota bacterium]MCG2706385.1 1-acyl-sn-glycerol-3-phosphate acyltransferase [Candidatus Omnitrophota bacterium]
MLYSILRLIAILIFKVLFRIRVFGKKYIPKNGGFILASNHLSYLDPIVLGIVCSRRLNYMARHDLFYNPFFSWLLTRINVFPVRRSSPDLSALKEAIKRLKNGQPLVLFPTGTRELKGLSLEPQAGIGFLAAKVDVPVIPVLIKGTQEALPKGAKFIRPGKISVYFGEQIPIERRMPYQAIALRIMEGIRRLGRWQ